jgi:hypothetical protein
MALPGPAVGFLQLALRWWDAWLKGCEAGLAHEPLLRIWMQDSVRPAAHRTTLPGRWVAERAWPSSRISPRRYVLHRARLAPESGPEVPLSLRSPETVGLHAGRWCPYQITPDLPLDQWLEDAGALTFDTDPLPERLEILGPPVADLEVAVDRPVALIAARLSDVAPDGAATRVTYGLLNLTHRESHEHPTPLQPGRRYRVRVQLNDVAQAFPAGHRIRLAISTTYWPTVWPAPEPVTLTLYAGASMLTLPVRPPDPADAALPLLPSVETAPPLPVTAHEPARTERVVRHDVITGEVTLDWIQDSGRHRYEDIDLTVHTVAADRFSIRPEDPLSARAEVAWTVRLVRGDWRVETRTRTELTATRDTFEVVATLEAFEGETPVHAERWERSIPRDLV